MGSLVNKNEEKHFLRTALTWTGSVTPKVLPRVFVVILYSFLVLEVTEVIPWLKLPVTPFEYSGAILGLLMVLRVNSGHERWWEARKIWGSIVNQSRNLAIIGSAYRTKKDESSQVFLKHVAAWPYIIKQSLRDNRSLNEIESIVGKNDAREIEQAVSMPFYFGKKIADLLAEFRNNGLDDFAFQRAERERALLIDAFGACERIKKTPIPFVLAIKTRRFILLFLLFLPLALVDKVGLLTPIVASLVAYPLFSLDEIGVELQDPFSVGNISHLPLNQICETIERNILSLQAPREPSATIDQKKIDLIEELLEVGTPLS